MSRELDTLASWVAEASPRSILEVGSGWGRVHNHLRQSGYLGHYCMCDFVDSLRQRCLQETGIPPDGWDGRTLPYLSATFDMVVSFSVLLHVPPSDLGRVFAEHVRVTKRWFYIATFFQREGWVYKGGASHLHDYIPLIEKHRLVIVDECRFGGRINWLLRKE